MARRKRVLFIEGDESLRQLLAMALQLEGFDVVTAGNLDEVRRQLEEARPDIILSCMTMPQMNAYALLRWLREEQKMDVPVMVLTRRAVEGTREQLLKAGAQAVAFKPTKVSELVQALKAL